MRLNPIAVTLIALITLAAVLGLAGAFLRPAGPIIASAEFSHDTLSPNADGINDIARISYDLRRPASVSIYFLDSQGTRYDFRSLQPRDSGEHSLFFSGVVEGYALPADQTSATILRRVLRDGAYTWMIEATANGETAQAKGTLTIENADTALPDLKSLSASPAVFTPNQAGLDDRATINVWLEKEIPDTGLHVTLIGLDGAQYPMAEAGTATLPGRAGLHTYDYDGGIDLGVNPPPDGTYTVRAEAEDKVGQKTQTETTITLKNSGLPRAEIHNGDVQFSDTTVVIGQTLYFTVTVENYGTAPLRTSGPYSGWVYDSMETNPNTLGYYEESGAWRVGIDCDSCIRDYPWRWALGTPQTLTALTENGQSHYYLMPGERAVVTGGIVLDKIIEARNPQYFWAGLIHEDVEISNINNRVDPHLITIVPKK